MMTVHPITVTVPADLYDYLEARATQRSIEDMLVQTARTAVPAPIEADLPEDIRRELEAIAHLSDAALWSIALNIATTDKIALADALLAQLREETDALMRLKGRGHTLPALDSLPVPVV